MASVKLILRTLSVDQTVDTALHIRTYKDRKRNLSLLEWSSRERVGWSKAESKKNHSNSANECCIISKIADDE
jgi:hypothetical protein